ncbi:MAG: HNH endonuclease domain-containing protein [Termitinemataceae bacterium]|nr:MAG: HNH endonuclease domain-containing protein [Termitinemataceae bacterium]
MNWRLGLDLGTNSIGWSVLGLNSKNDVEELVNMGSRIFSDGREPKTGVPLAVERRTARGIRRSLLRRKLRRKQLFCLLQKEALFPQTREEAHALKKCDPYKLRFMALDKKLEPYELGRALFHLGVRRGFKSNRKDAPDVRLDADSETSIDTLQTKESEKLGQAERILIFQSELEKSNARTLGEYLFTKKQFRFSSDKTRYYPTRQMYDDEFKKISAKQKAFYPNLNWDAISTAIFFQRPLRPQERGKCQFDSGKPRTFKAMPCSHKFRILQEVFNLTYIDATTQRSTELTSEQQDILINELDSRKEMGFSSMRKLLKTNGTFNLETMNRDKLNGNTTACKMRKDEYFGKLWDTLKLEEQDEIVEKLITADEDDEVLPVLEKYPLNDEQKKSVLRITFVSGTTSFCKEITEALVAKMQETHLQYDKAAEVLGYKHSDQSVEEFDVLPYYGKVLTGSTLGAGRSNDENQPELKYGKIANPTVHVALNQTRTVVNALIKKYGKPAQIVVEVSRDLKASREAKAEMQRKQTENQKRNAILNKNITDTCQTIKFPNRADRLKWRLWEELSENSMTRRCPYCGEVIAAADVFSQDIEIEHILPFSRTLLGAESNLTVAHRKCNAFKKENSPWEAFHTNPHGYNWVDIVNRAAQLKNPAKRRRFTEDAMESFEKESSFIARQLTDNAYLSRISLRYLKSVCDNIWSVNGGMTKLLRDKWEIDSILKGKIGEKEAVHFNLDSKLIGEFKKNRYDHRHHALDAMVIGLTDRSMVQNIATMCGHSLKHRIEVPQPFDKFDKNDLIEKVRNIVVSFKPDHGVEGKLSKETALGRIMIDGVPTFVNRVPITSLKTEKNISDIVDPVIKKRLHDFVSSKNGEKFEQVIMRFSEETGIKKVRCKTFAQSPIEIPPRKNNPLSVTRYYNPLDYFAAVIWEVPSIKADKKPKYEAQYVRRTEVDKKGNLKKEILENKPHPAAKKICQLHKNDYIEFSENGIWKKARIAGYHAKRNLVDIRPIYATNDILSWIIATANQVLEKGWKPVKGQNFMSVNVLFGELSAHKITVSPIGEVNRKPKK